MPQKPEMNEKYFRHQAMMWLIVAAITAVIWLLIWLTSAAPKIINKPQDKQITSKDIALPIRIENFVDLEKEVKPIDFSALVRDLRNYPDEFKDKTYFEAIAKRYTIEVMDIAENDVIVDYLNGQDERKNFAYFRYLDKTYKKPRYILTYGKFQTAQEAQSAIANIDFGLPKTVAVKVVAVSSYLGVIDNYMRAQNITDLATKQPRHVRLQKTQAEIPVQAATEQDEDIARRSQERVQEYLSEHDEVSQASLEKLNGRQIGDKNETEKRKSSDVDESQLSINNKKLTERNDGETGDSRTRLDNVKNSQSTTPTSQAETDSTHEPMIWKDSNR